VTPPDTQPSPRIEDYRALLQQGRFDDALDQMRAELPSYPDHPYLNKLIGVAYLLSGRPGDSIAYFEKCTTLDATNAEARFDLAAAFEADGKLNRAAEALRDAIRIDNDYADAHNNLGLVLGKQGQLTEAAGHLRRAAAIKPDSAVFHSNFATLLKRQGAQAEAAEHFEEAIRLDPAFAQAYGNYGDMLQFQNRLEDVRALLDRAAPYCDPDDPGLLDLRAHLATDEKDFQTAAACLEKALEKDAAEDLKHRRFSLLGKAKDRLGDYDGAFRSFADANRYSAKLAARRNIEAARYADHVDALIAHMGKKSSAVSASAAVGERESPVFLVGFPRSGTTLLDTILRSHPDVSVMEEEPFVTDIRQSAGLIAPSSMVHNFSDAERVDLQKSYVGKVERKFGKRSSPILVDKFPLNLVEAGFIRSVFPDAKFILALRHPNDCVLSCFMQSFDLNDAMANFLDIGDAARLYDRSMTLWELYCDRLAIDCHAIKYEDVVADMRGAVEPLLGYLGLAWDDNVENYRQTALDRGHINTPSYNQVTQPMYSHAKGRWQRYEEQMRAVDGLLRPWIEKWGYD